MNPKEFDDKILTEKKARFLVTVKKTAKYFDVPVPPVEFHEDKCPYDGGNEWAHIHLDTGIICVSKRRLKQMSYEQIEETARHEATHLIDPTHDQSFHKEMDSAKLGTWSPPGGVYVHQGQSSVKTKSRMSKIDKTRCNYHLCRKKRTLTRCEYCNYYFCSEHIKPRPPEMPNFKSSSYADLLKENDPNTHPCPDYAVYLIKQEEKRKKREYENLKKLLADGKKRKSKKIRVDQDELDQMEHEEKELLKSLKESKKIETGISKTFAENSENELKEKPKDSDVKVKEIPKKKKSKIKPFIIVGVILTIILIIIILLFSGIISISSEANETSIVLINKTQTEVVPIDITFAKYFDNKEDYEDRIISITGFLQNSLEGSETAGMYVNYLVDDFGREIVLKNISAEQKSLFLKNQITKDVYEVTGTFKRTYKGIDIFVTKIIKSQKETQEISNIISAEQNVTQTVEKKERIDFQFVVDKIKSLF